VRFVPDAESHVWQRLSERCACFILLQRATGKLLIWSAISDKDFDNGSKMAGKRCKSARFLPRPVHTCMRAPFCGHFSDAAQHSVGEVLRS
jgi:hypothetical protein